MLCAVVEIGTLPEVLPLPWRLQLPALRRALAGGGVMLKYDEQSADGQDGTAAAEVAPEGADEGGKKSAPMPGLLDEVVAFVGRFMDVTPHQGDALALWVAHTHTVDAFDVVAYLFITSAEKRCGKSLLLDLLERLSCRGRSTANISPAALYRMVDEVRPTLLFDEVDNIFPKGRKVDQSKSDLVGLINAGFRKGRVAYRMGGPNMRTLEAFDAFGPKALAGLGGCLPDTTEDRAITIRLERKARNVTKDRYRIRIHESQADELGGRIAEAFEPLVEELRTAWPDLPSELNDRQQDIWEPLLSIADAAGGEWPKRARDAAKALCTTGDTAESLGARLLGDIRTVFTADRLLTTELVDLLNKLDESPWSDWRHGEGISSNQLATRLRDFGVKSKPMRVGADRGRGLERDQFDRVFDAYLSPPGHPTDDTVDTVDTGTNPQIKPVITRPNPSVDANVDSPDLHKLGSVNGVNGVTGEVPGNAGGGAPICEVCGTECRPGVSVHPTCMEIPT
ncbi:MAG: DUF3631 domain-containing protein [Acidimicrobiales bacterium]